jgi:NAD-dependent SIR2 family protein deacetylase
MKKKAQNIDTLETRAGVKNLIQCHGLCPLLTATESVLTQARSADIDLKNLGTFCRKKINNGEGSFAKFTCLKCRAKYPASQFEDLIAQGQVILCPTCDKLKTMEASKPTSKKRRKMDVYKFDDASSGDDGPDMDWVELGLMKPDITFFVCIFLLTFRSFFISPHPPMSWGRSFTCA